MKRLILALIMMTSATMQAQQPAAAKPAKTQGKQQSAQNKGEDEGQRVFTANCSRCHTVPNNITPSVAGTVLRHMRVRASLSAADEKALLRFMGVM